MDSVSDLKKQNVYVQCGDSLVACRFRRGGDDQTKLAGAASGGRLDDAVQDKRLDSVRLRDFGENVKCN